MRGCPRIENLLRKSPFGQISRSFSLNSHHYSPQIIEKSDSKGLSLATAPILGQPPSNLLENFYLHINTFVIPFALWLIGAVWFLFGINFLVVALYRIDHAA